MTYRATADNIYGPAPSDGGPWRTYYNEELGEAHVMPGFERRKHVLHLTCWCHPAFSTVPDEEAENVIVHNVAQ